MRAELEGAVRGQAVPVRVPERAVPPVLPTEDYPDSGRARPGEARSGELPAVPVRY